jgi:OmpA-OmpF porin, OOP family
MKYLPGHGHLKTHLKTWVVVSAQTLLTASVMLAVTPTNSKTFNSGEKAEVKGVILSHDGDTIKVRGDDDTIDTIDLTNTTKIQLKHGIFGSKSTMETSALVPGLHIEAKGKGSDKGDLVAERVIFDPNSMRASRQIDARVSPLEARTGGVENREGQLEGRAGTLETRAGQIEGRQGELESTEKQTQAQVGQVKTVAEQANQGVNTVNSRVSNLDNYDPKDTATVYFKINSATLTPQAKKDLEELAQKAKTEKGYTIEVAGFADTTGNAAVNQALSQRRADAVIQYLEENGDIPIHRILAPAGLGTSHEAADNHTSAGRKLNRRVEVKILVNQGLVGSSTAQNEGAPASSTTPSAPPASSTTTTNPPQQ